MQRLSELAIYTVSKYGETLAPEGYVYDSDEVEELVSELDDAFENCKMELESAKATIEELQEKIAKADELLKMFSENTGYDIDFEDYTLVY